jgi:fimbrial chaperone protein
VTKLAFILLLAIAAIAAGPALAGSLSVSPIRVDLSNAQRSVALTVRNDGDQPSVVQAQLVAWSQDNNEDKLEPTNDLIASPPVFTIPGGGSQIVRVALRRAPDGGVERSYRILVTEVPGKAQPGFSGAQFALKISLPIFVEAAAAKTEPKIAWTAKKLPSGELALTTTNTGSAHIQVISVELSEQSTVDATHAAMWYVLPGRSRTVNIKPLPGRTFSGERIRVKAETDAGPIATDVAVSADAR